MKDEAAVKRAAVLSVKHAGGYGRRIEDQYAVGTLDTMLILPNYPPVFAEFKLIKGNVFEPTDRQLVEMRRIDAAGGIAIAALVGWKDGQHFFSKTTERADIRYCFVQPEGTTFAEALGAFIEKEWRYEQR